MQENLHSGTCHNLNVATDEIYQKNCTVVKIGIFSSYCNFDIILLNMYIFVIFLCLQPSRHGHAGGKEVFQG